MRAVKGFIIATICLVLVVAIGLGAVLVMGLTGNLKAGNLFSFAPSMELANRQEFAAGDFDSLLVEYSSERIILLPGQEGRVVLEEYMSRWDEGMLARISTDGRRLDIRAGNRPAGSWMNWNAEIKLYVPASWAADVSLKNSSGSIRAEDERFSFGAFSAATSSGSIRLGRVTAQGDLRLQSSSGSVNAEQLEAGGSAAASATSGALRLERVQARDVELRTSSGSIRVGQAAAERVAASASSGSINFERLDGVFELSNTSGGLHVEGGAGSGSAKTSSGSLRIRLDELNGDLSLNTTSGSCRLSVPGGQAFSFFAQTSSGSIRTPDDGGLSYNQRGNEASGSFGPNPVYRVEMRASSGSVKLEWS